MSEKSEELTNEAKKTQTNVIMNDHELEKVPMNKRLSLFAVFSILICWVINPTPAVVGGSIASGMSLSQALLAIGIGALILGLYSIPISIAGAKEGVSISMVSRITFGERGSNIVAVVMAVANVIFYGVTVGFFVISLEAVLGKEPGSLAVLAGILFCLLFGVSAFFGIKGLSLISKIIVIPMLILFIVAAARGVSDGGGWSKIMAIGAQTEPMSLATGITAAIGIFIAGATMAADVTRFSKNGKESSISSFLAFGVGFFAFVSMGAIAVKGTGSGDLITLVVTMGGVVFTIIAFLLLLFSTWSSADNNVYSAGLAFSKLFNKPKYIFTIATVLIGAVVAATGVYQNLAAYTGLLAMLMPPIGAIISIDYFYVKKGIKDKTANISNYNMTAIVAWSVAVLVDFFTGNPLGLLPYKIGVSGINGLLVGAVVYFVLSLVMPKVTKKGSKA